jgi:head-tail adaptor
MALNPGAFDELVSIQKPVVAENEFGESEKTGWVDVETDIFAAVTYPNPNALAKEIAIAGRQAMERVCTFRLRWPLEIGEGYRVLWNDEAYAAEGIAVDRCEGIVTVTGIFRSGSDGR